MNTSEQILETLLKILDILERQTGQTASASMTAAHLPPEATAVEIPITLKVNGVPVPVASDVTSDGWEGVAKAYRKFRG